MLKIVKDEVIEIHSLFQSWYNGSMEKDALDKDLGKRLSKDFYIVFPDASKNSKTDLFNMMKRDFGNDESYRIEIKNIEVHKLLDSIYLGSYQEWQYWGDSNDPKLKIQTSSVLQDTEGSLEWIAIHETEIK